jgi:recombinational DNA repair ATPase RecF
MRLSSFAVVGVGPIKNVSVERLSDTVVLAGPNGVGKTNVITSLMMRLRNAQPEKDITLVVEATNENEAKEWGKKFLDTKILEDCNRLRTTLHRNQRRNKYKSSILNFDSDRAIRNIQPFSFS